VVLAVLSGRRERVIRIEEEKLWAGKMVRKERRQNGNWGDGRCFGRFMAQQTALDRCFCSSEEFRATNAARSGSPTVKQGDSGVFGLQNGYQEDMRDRSH
jgi:hypothetical protein